MPDIFLVTAALATATFGIRLFGFWLGRSIPAHGPWARALNALPGCLITALVAVLLVQGGPAEWIAATAAAITAYATRSLPLSMIAGIAVVLLARMYL